MVKTERDGLWKSLVLILAFLCVGIEVYHCTSTGDGLTGLILTLPFVFVLTFGCLSSAETCCKIVFWTTLAACSKYGFLAIIGLDGLSLRGILRFLSCACIIVVVICVFFHKGNDRTLAVHLSYLEAIKLLIELLEYSDRGRLLNIPANSQIIADLSYVAFIIAVAINLVRNNLAGTMETLEERFIDEVIMCMEEEELIDEKSDDTSW